MFLTFNSQKNEGHNPRKPAGKQHTRPSQTPYAPHLANACNTYEVQVDKERDEPGERGDQQVWRVMQLPPQPLARGHVITLRGTTGTIVGSGRVSTVTLITRHWITARFYGGHVNTFLRVPTPWINLGKLDRFTHTELYASLPKLPEPHAIFRNRPSFTNDNENPYQFDIDPREREELREKLMTSRRLRQTLDIAEGIEKGPE